MRAPTFIKSLEDPTVTLTVTYPVSEEAPGRYLTVSTLNGAIEGIHLNNEQVDDLILALAPNGILESETPWVRVVATYGSMALMFYAAWSFIEWLKT